MTDKSDKSDKRVLLSLSLTIEDDQGLMFNCPIEWHNLPYEGALHIQGRLVELLAELNSIGKNLLHPSTYQDRVSN